MCEPGGVCGGGGEDAAGGEGPPVGPVGAPGHRAVLRPPQVGVLGVGGGAQGGAGGGGAGDEAPGGHVTAVGPAGGGGAGRLQGHRTPGSV